MSLAELIEHCADDVSVGGAPRTAVVVTEEGRTKITTLVEGISNRIESEKMSASWRYEFR